jgi:hypothetical protein
VAIASPTAWPAAETAALRRLRGLASYLTAGDVSPTAALRQLSQHHRISARGETPKSHLNTPTGLTNELSF